MTDLDQEVEAAEGRIREFVPESPVAPSPDLAEQLGASVYLKLENLQVTGSFKIRGAFNKLLSLDVEARRRGIVTASTGNHGIAVRYAAEELGIPGMIVLPENVSPRKVEALKNSPLEVKLFGSDCVAAETFARQESLDRGSVYVSPYNDPLVIAGQGTIAIELARQLDAVEVVLVPVGGGGLISGIAGYLRETGRPTRVIGCLPETSPEMYRSVQAGRRIEPLGLATLSDGTVGGFEAGSITFELCQRYVSDWVLVNEDEIRDAMRTIVERHGLRIEGSAAVVVAAAFKLGKHLAGKNVALVVSGGNVDPGKFEELSPKAKRGGG